MTEFDKSVNELTLKLFEKGYDVRFQTTQAMPVFINEMVVRLLYSIRRLIGYYIFVPKKDRSWVLLWKSCEPFSNATVKRMLTVAHGTFCIIEAAPQLNPGGVLVPQTEKGLTGTGFEFLAKMEWMHMIVDVSHLSDKGFWDIVEHGTRPFAASHSNCRALAPHTRNLTDEMIRALAERGGIAGLNYYAPFLDADPTHPESCRSTVDRIAKHAAHYKQVGGAQMIALGSDFDGIDGAHQLENASCLPLLADALRKEGFTEDEVEGVYSLNARRFFEQNL